MSEYKIDYCHHDSVTMESRQDYIKREDAIEMVLEPLNNMPAADVVEVVRCKKCKNWDAETHSCNIRDSYGWDYKPTDYCSYGEKKDEL